MLLNGLWGNDSDALQLFSFFPVLLLTKFTKKNYRAMKIFAVASSFSEGIFRERLGTQFSLARETKLFYVNFFFL